MEIEVRGLDSLMKKLDALGVNVQQSVNAGLLKLGGDIRDAAKEMCPVDSGNLRGSITVTAPDDNTVVIGTNVDYAVYVEYGTGPKGDPSVPHTTKTSWRYRGKGGEWRTSRGQEPQPFLRPAFIRYKDKAGDIIKRELERRIEEAGG